MASQAIVPNVIEDDIASALMAAQDVDRNASVIFAYEVKMVKANNAMGKEWTAKELVDASGGADPFAELRGPLQLAPPKSDTKALPAPNKKKSR